MASRHQLCEHACPKGHHIDDIISLSVSMPAREDIALMNHITLCEHACPRGHHTDDVISLSVSTPAREDITLMMPYHSL
jgi:hypothetical protein